MIIKDKLKSDLQSNFKMEKLEMDIDKKNIHKILGMLSKLYSNTASFVREWTSNAWDAHVKAGEKDTPVIFRILENKVQVEDFGTGMGPEIVKNVVSKFGSSSKEEDETVIGHYGLNN